VKVVSAAFNAAKRQGYIDTHPCTALESFDNDAEEKAPFTASQVAKLVRAAEGDWRGAILLGYYTGARLGDVVNMRWSAVDWREKAIRFTPSKTKKPVTIPLHPQRISRGDVSEYLKWRASKLKPRVYGERTEQYVQNVTNNVVVLTEERARELQKRLKRPTRS
jgi:integrase